MNYRDTSHTSESLLLENTYSSKYSINNTEYSTNEKLYYYISRPTACYGVSIKPLMFLPDVTAWSFVMSTVKCVYSITIIHITDKCMFVACVYCTYYDRLIFFLGFE